MQTLEELKAENAAIDEDPVETPTTEEAEEQTVEVETETPIDSEESSEAGEPSEEKTEDTETEAWMQSDEDTDGQASADIPNSAWKAAREKYKAKLQKHKEESGQEVEQLKAEIEKLKGSQPQQLNRPKREDFDNADDPDEAFAEALVDWKLEQNNARTAAKTKEVEQTRQAEEYKQSVSKAVDQHYERAVKLAEKSDISAEVYQSADLKVRQAVESVFPEKGDDIYEALIANLGEGSEKVSFNLGVNTARRNRFVSLLTEDKTGLKAAVYLGTLNAELSAPAKRQTTAPDPATQLKGNENASQKYQSLKAKYTKAHKVGDSQAAFDAKRAAKQAGADTSKW